jgi:hypothetical protein
VKLSRKSLAPDLAYRSWKPVQGWQMIAASVGFGILFILLKTDDDGFLSVVDHANLVFHEAGHVVFGILGGTLGLYGGTLGQLAIPLIVGAAFWKQRDAIGTAIAGVWFFQNFFNIAHYMADARAQLLPLVGGGDHDWTNIFSRWGALASDIAIANLVAAAGWIGMVAVWGWLVCRWLDASQESAA